MLNNIFFNKNVKGENVVKDVKTLTKEEKNDKKQQKNEKITQKDKVLIERLIKIDAILKSMGSNKKLSNYNAKPPYHLKQIAFHKCDKKIRFVFGGNRSGKSECGAVETVWLARGIHPYKQNKKDVMCWVVSLTSQVQRDVVQKKILSYINKKWIVDLIMLSGKKENPENGIIDQIIIKNVFGGQSVIGFRNCEQGREKFQGTSLDFVWFDEEPPEDVFNECKMRVFDKRGILFATMTPLKGLTWVYDKIYLNSSCDDNIWYEFMEWADNPYLDKDEIEELTKSLSESELKSRRYGTFNSNEGIVYTEFDESVHVIEPFDVPKEWYDNISIDPGLKNPLSCHFYATDYDGNVYVIAEHYESGLGVMQHAEKIKAIADRLQWHRGAGGRLNALIDSAANQRTLASEKSVSELFYDYGINVNSNVNKDLFSGINRVKSYLRTADGKTRLYIFSCCSNLIREIKGYFWGNSDAPIKRDDHALDELRYFIMSKPEKKMPTKQKNIIQKDKERLMRRIKHIR